MNGIYLCSHPVLSTCVGGKKRRMGGQLPKPLTVLTPLTANTPNHEQ